MRNTSLRLSLALSALIVGVCVVTFRNPELPTKNVKPGVADLVPPAQPVSPQASEPLIEAVTKQTSPFDPSGDYHPRSQVLDESERFVQFVLETRRRRKKLIAWGHVSNVGEWYKFKSISVSEKRLKFRTENVRNVEYRFDGRFLGKGNFAEQYSGYTGSVMLEGTLQKFVNGQKAFEINTPFVHYPGC